MNFFLSLLFLGDGGCLVIGEREGGDLRDGTHKKRKTRKVRLINLISQRARR